MTNTNISMYNVDEVNRLQSISGVDFAEVCITRVGLKMGGFFFL